MANNIKEKSHYMRDSEWEIARALANLWAWSTVIEQKEDPTSSTYYVYPSDLALRGPTNLNGHRIVIKIELEKQATR